MAAVSGVLSVVVFVIGQYVAPELVYPEEQVGGVQLTFYVNYEDRLLAQAILVGVGQHAVPGLSGRVAGVLGSG